ncbi:hypothetical protein ACFSQ3_13020 [Sphingobacterium corticis]|uniref:Uncharacterized protein n=1 Tax=Sphingobacterium corticis TaxID=1812823 RepID=A0ABW5NPW5_9SPHI
MENNLEIFNVDVSGVTLLDLNKKYIANLAEQARVALMDGQIDEMKLFVTAKKGKELFEQLEKTVRPFAESSARIGSNQIYSAFGCDITESMNGVRYDFTNCDDSEWNEMNAEMTILKKRMSDREKFLKTLTKPMADPESGEIINPPIKSGKLGLNVRIG